MALAEKMKSRQTYLLALLSAFLLWLAWPPIPFTTPLLLIALVPLFVALEHVKDSVSVKTGKRIFLTAGLSFLVWNTASTYWVYNAISAYNTGFIGTIVSFVVSLIPYGLGALLMTFAFWLFYRLGKYTSKTIAYLGLISFYIALEYLQQTWDLAFPWMTLGNGLAGMHQLAQWYDYTGVYGGSLWILLSNILAFETYKSLKSNSKGYLKYRTAGTWVLIVIIPTGISLIKYFNTAQKGTPSNVVVVQPNIDPYQKFEVIPAAEQINILTHLSDSIGQTNTEYFIWPETAIPNYANEDRIRSNPDFITLQNFLNKYKNGTLITGIETVKTYPDKRTISTKYRPDWGFYDNFNSAMQVENSANVQFYHKSKLVPGAEKMPFPKVFSFMDGVFSELGGSVGGWGWQDKPSVLYAQSGIGAAPVVCYESLWGDWIGQQVKDGAQFIAIITNDGWWGNTSGKSQHELYAKLRAIETRRDIARSANTGISCFINQRGDVTQSTQWWQRTAIKANINLNDEITFYVKNGDLIARLLCGIAVILALIIPYKKWRKNRGLLHQ